MKLANFLRKSFLTGLCVGFLSGCSWFESWPYNKDNAHTDAPHQTVSTTAESKTSPTAQWLPPGSNGQELLHTQNTLTQNNLPMASKGIAIDPASQDRLSRLEQELEQIKNDIKLMMPALARLAEAQGSIQKSLIAIEPAAGHQNIIPAQQAPSPLMPSPSLETTTPAEISAAPAQQIVPESEPTIPQNPRQSYENRPQIASTAPSVTNVRFGEHPDKTRLVLDTSSKLSFQYDLDNKEKILMVTLPDAGWSGLPQMNVGNSPLVSSYNVVSDQQGGQQLIIQLKHPARVLWAQALAPGGPQGYRIVFDLAAL